MRRVAIALVLVALALGSLGYAFAPSTLQGPTAVPVRASYTAFPCPAQFSCNYSDPASDVAWMWPGNNSHVTNSTGGWILTNTPMAVNLIRLSSSATATAISVFLKVQNATINTLANTTYQYRLYTRSDNTTHYIVTYHDGLATMATNHTGSAIVNLTASTQVGTQGWLEVTVPKANLGGTANITAWNIDATSRMNGSKYYYSDFVWSLPGNPASAPAAVQGHVTDAVSGAPLKDVNVSVPSGGFYTTTNASGYYLLPATYGNLTISFSLPGYVSASKSVTVNVSSTATVNAQLSPVAPPPSLGDYAWLIVAVVIIAVVAIAALALLRRRSRSKPKPPVQ